MTTTNIYVGQLRMGRVIQVCISLYALTVCNLSWLGINNASAQQAIASLPPIINLLLDECSGAFSITDVTSFEGTNSSFTPTGDWQRGAPIGFAGGAQSTEPPSARTGMEVFGTVLGGDHSPSLVSELTSSPISFSSTDCPGFAFYEWIDSGINSFDTAEVLINGEVVYLSDGFSNDQWRRVELDLSDYGRTIITIQFRFTATTVVERTGWYIDDLELLIR